MKNFYRNKLSVLLLVAALGFGLVFSGQAPAASGVSPDQCCRCHGDVCEESLVKRYVHAPVLDHQCGACHIADRATADPQSEPPSATRPEKHEEIAWFAKDCEEEHEHWFELPVELANSTVSLLARANGRKVLDTSVVLPALEQAQYFPAPQGQPEIYDLRVIEVKKGIFLSARVAWKTDRITDAQILYRDGMVQESTALDSGWATAHALTITGLEAARNYEVVAVSQDIYGNKTMSAPLRLSTHRFYSAPAVAATDRSEGIDLDFSFYREQDRLFGRFATSHPVAMRLGHNGELVRATGMADPGRQIPQGHLPLTDPRTLTITVCVGCHPEAKSALSHPVDVSPRNGMRIPVDYHTLADGRLSCMSCHQAHASQNEYRLSRPTRKDLCLGCHRNFG